MIPQEDPWAHKVFLTLNAGSSSFKVAMYGAYGDDPIVTGQADRIGPEGTLKLKDSEGKPLAIPPGDLTTHSGALATAIAAIRARFPNMQLAAVGHRVVHGGLKYAAPVVIDDQVFADLVAISSFAPLHQPHNMAGVKTAMEAFPGVPQVACFDTAFHRGQPFVNDTFAIPFRYYEEGVRRYGFHGLSYEYVTGELERIAPHLMAGRVVVAHLGNGASMCAIYKGRSVASSMGFSVLDGLPMGTRCGQIDPGVLLYMLEKEKLSTDEIRQILYNESGLLGLSGGMSNDMRTLEAADNAASHRAIDYFVFRVQRELGGMTAVMGGIDALVFCGGIGENSRVVRRRVCERLGWMGIEIDHGKNAESATIISSEFARTTVMIVPTHEDLVIARAARKAAGVPEKAAA
ncbi:acetate/propionate family kinase [Paenirhodobacter populi]|uniref:Acetate kinase n=1 Tax=Paenirhodobacter populi TaxID=2306993 RepID=A0A443ITP8_9RHOB|nr:acetate/propionate family kinase [Sinirhodobacter populi]RWR04223.1 acetate/propionate family kinase [Sinirhodobacter populi]RWR11077.1 acetate/propionate family kinase [Sinirhodobacter populi]RWR21173.1 acetate/propionate family kinase [Sinirhodobacter populi]RWR35050.1 acetate/propionate family kinase [Sinirhodobacter populi]